MPLPRPPSFQRRPCGAAFGYDGVLLMKPLLLACLAALFACCAFAQLPPERQLARDVFEQLININTTDSIGDNAKAAEAMAERFRSAGFPEKDVQVLVQAPRKGNLVVRYRGTGSA